MKTLHHTRTADGISIRLIEREIKPRFVIILGTRNTGGFAPVGNDRAQAVMEWMKAVQRIKYPVGRRAG